MKYNCGNPEILVSRSNKFLAYQPSESDRFEVQKCIAVSGTRCLGCQPGATPVKNLLRDLFAFSNMLLRKTCFMFGCVSGWEGQAVNDAT